MEGISAKECGDSSVKNEEIVVKSERCGDESDDDTFSGGISLFGLSGIIQKNQDPLEFSSTDAMMDSYGSMVCMLCYKRLPPEELHEHMTSTHAYRRVLFQCSSCNTTFHERQLLTVHKTNCTFRRKKRAKRTFQQILREVESKEFLEDGEEIATCPICLLDLSKFHLKGHLLAQHKKADECQSCAVCEKTFKSKNTLREHVRLVHEAVENSATCNLCGQTFRSAKYVQNHKRNVHPSGNKVHLCDICGKEFKSHLSLHQHSRHVHPPASAARACLHCGQSFKCAMNLRQHLRVSHGIHNTKNKKS